MGITVAWDNPEKTILRYVHYGGWTWAELDAAVAEARHRFRSVTHPVHVIIDLRESRPLPPLTLMPPLPTRPVLSLAPDRGSKLIFVGSAAITRPYQDAARLRYRARRSKSRVAFIPTLEEARLRLRVMAPNYLSAEQFLADPAFDLGKGYDLSASDPLTDDRLSFDDEITQPIPPLSASARREDDEADIAFA
jgi:hypothetical protein